MAPDCREELVRACLAEAEWFAEDEFGKTGIRTRDDQFGNRITIQRRRGGRYDLTIKTFPDRSFDLNAKDTRKLKWSRDNGAELNTAVTEILARVCRPREAQS